MSCLQTRRIKAEGCWQCLVTIFRIVYVCRRCIKIACQSENREASACGPTPPTAIQRGYTVTFIGSCPHMMWHKWRQSGHRAASLKTLWWARGTEMWLLLAPPDPLLRSSSNLASLSAGTHVTLAESSEVADKDFNPAVCSQDEEKEPFPLLFSQSFQRPQLICNILIYTVSSCS